MKRFLLILAFLLIGWHLSAQITERNTQLFLNGGETVMTLNLNDKKTMEPMAGAIVYLSCRKDTLKTVTGTDGTCYIDKIPFKIGKDTIQVNVSFMGYKDLSYKYIAKPLIRLQGLMEEDPEQLSEIIVKGNAVAMVVRGDTTIYNADAFITMEGDDLGALLKKLPGISMDSGILYANGKQVSKILLNGSAMFNTNLGAAMELVKSDEVKKVRIYDEYDQTRLAEADTLGGKERVVDVQTKKPVDIIQRISLSAATGIYRDKNKEGRHDWIAGLSGDYNRYGTNLPSYTVNASLGQNLSHEEPSTAPTRNGDVRIETNHFNEFSNRYNHSLNIGFNEGESENYSKNIYTPTTFFQEKETENTCRSKHSDLYVTYHGITGWSLDEKNTIESFLDLAYRHEKKNNLTANRTITDGKNYLSDILEDGGSGHGNLSGNLYYNHYFEKIGRALNIGIGGGYSRDTGEDHRTDTSALTSIAQWIRATQKREEGQFRLNVNYQEPLTELWYLSMSYDLNGQVSNQKRLSFDRILDQTDSVNTYDYRHSSLTNRLSAGFRFRQRGFNLSASLYYNLSSQLRTDRFPAGNDYPRTYQHLSPNIFMMYNSAKFNLNFNYSEQQRIPSIQETRKMLDNSSPLFLRAGNPDLKQSIQRTGNLSVHLNFPKIGSSLRGLVNLTFVQNATARKTSYFTEETLLPEYGYLAQEGAQLSQTINVNGQMNLFSELSWSSYVNPINTSFDLGPTFRLSRNPFMTGEELHLTHTHDMGVDLSIQTNLTRFVGLSISSSTAFGKNRLDGETVYNSVSEQMGARLKVNLFEHLWLDTDFNWNWMGTDEEKAPGYHREIWNAGIEWEFGKKKEFVAGFDWKDILNRSNSWSTSITENFISSDFTTLYGTSFLVHFRFEF